MDRQQAGERDDDGSFELADPLRAAARFRCARRASTLVVEHDACATSEPLVLRLVPRADLPVYETVVVAGGTSLASPCADRADEHPWLAGRPVSHHRVIARRGPVAWPAPIYAIRGSNPGKTGHFLDDLPVPLLFHLALGPSVIHPAFFDSMAFYPGGYSARYGRYAAGVVASQTRAPAEDRVHAAAEVRLYDAGGMPLGAAGPTATAAWPQPFVIPTPGRSLSLLRNDLHLSYWDYQFRADRRVRGWALTLAALRFGRRSGLPVRATSYCVHEYLLRFHRASLRASRSVGDGQLVARVSLGADHSTAPIVKAFPITADAYEHHSPPKLRARNRARGLGGGHGRAGAMVAAHVRRGGGGRIRSGAHAHGPACGRLRLGQHPRHGSPEPDPGTAPRQLHHQRRDEDRIWDRGFPRAWLLNEKAWLTGSGGRFSQAPSLTVQIPAAENFGLALYGLQTSWQGALGVGTRQVPGVEVEVTGYVQRYVLTDLRDPALLNPDPLASDFLVRRDARSYGLEVMIRRPASERLHGWISYTLSQSQRALGGVIGPSDWDQRHILNAVLGYRLGPYTLGVRGHLNTGRPVLVNGGQAETFVRLPSFYQLDLRAERRILFDAFTLNVYFELVNATLSREVYQIDQQPTGELSDAACASCCHRWACAASCELAFAPSPPIRLHGFGHGVNRVGKPAGFPFCQVSHNAFARLGCSEMDVCGLEAHGVQQAPFVPHLGQARRASMRAQ